MKFFAALQSILPQHHLSRGVGWLAHLEHPRWLKTLLIKLFMRSYGVSLDDAKLETPDSYRHFNAFFTRALRDGARPLATSRYVMPADGELSQCGPVTDDALIQAKGRYYSTAALLGADDTFSEAFKDGSFATIYLSPSDYHRIHMPISGTLRQTRYIPGDLFAVNQATVHSVDQLFARNERLVCRFETADGPMALVLVGAIIVAGIETVWGVSNDPGPTPSGKPTGTPSTRPCWPAVRRWDAFSWGRPSSCSRQKPWNGRSRPATRFRSKPRWLTDHAQSAIKDSLQQRPQDATERYR